MKTIIVFLVLLVFKVLCVPQPLQRCQNVNVDTDEVSGQCCLYVKNQFVTDGNEKAVQRFLDSVNKVSNVNKHGMNKIVYPDDGIRYRKVNTGESGSKVFGVTTESANKSVNIDSRVNVDVPETCTKGYKLDGNGECVEIFDDIE